MKEYLIILAFCIWSACYALDLGEESISERLQKKSFTTSGELNAREERLDRFERLQGAERYVRHILAMLDTISDRVEEKKKEDEDQSGKIPRRFARDVIHLPGIDLKPQENMMTPEEMVFPEPMTCPAMNLDFNTKRKARDVLHILRMVDENMEEKSKSLRMKRNLAHTHTHKTATNLSLIKGIITCLTELTDDEAEDSTNRPINIEMTHPHTPQEVVKDIFEHVSSHDHLERDPNDDHLKWKHEDNECQSNVELRKEDRSVSDSVEPTQMPEPQIDDTLDRQVQEMDNMEMGPIISNAEEMKRVARDVVHLPEVQSSNGEQHHRRCGTDSVNIQEPSGHLEIPKNLRDADYFTNRKRRDLKNPMSKITNKPAASDISLKRVVRDVIHLLKSPEITSNLHPMTNDVSQNANMYDDKVPRTRKRSSDSTSEALPIESTTMRNEIDVSTPASDIKDSPRAFIKTRLPLTAFAAKRNSVLKDRAKSREAAVSEILRGTKRKI
ncbi:uncharacterized protein LOC142233823 [Haematobia irritans]|uniref:uncharacterized protein LOC142233823 n=1 Tax=Haematobia irritans TaxID=7368 RepID=UPI003F50B1D9